MSTVRPADEFNLADALKRAYTHWSAGQIEPAEQLAQQVLAAKPGQADALNLLGLIAHARGQLDHAVEQLRLACAAPQVPALYWSNLAELARQKGLLDEALQAAQRAVEIQPDLLEAWNNLGIVRQELGQHEGSLQCLEQVIALKPDWAEAHNNLANTYRRVGRLAQAAQHYERALALKPGYAEAHSNLAFLLTVQGHYEQAAAQARQAIECNAQLVEAYLNLADAHSARRRHDLALQALDELATVAPELPAGFIARSLTLRHLERYEEALIQAERAVTRAPHSAEAHYVFGQALQTLGLGDYAMAHFDQAAQLPGTVTERALVASATLFMETGRREQALAAFEQVLAAYPHSVLALTQRAEAKTFQDGDPDIAALEGVLAREQECTATERIDAHFALGKAYLDTREPQRAFYHLDAGNRHKRATFDYDSAHTAKWLEGVAAAFTAEWLASMQGAGDPSELPVFIIGMPRSGTTLAEQILASHPQVFGAGELPTLRQLAEHDGTYPPGPNDPMPSRAAIAQLGSRYLGRVARLAQGHTRLVDKMPTNFFYAGVIAAALPGARIIHCRRDPVDTCLSCYTKQFAGGQIFSYEQNELGQFYQGYLKLMAHWRAVLPAERFLEVDYEAVVDDLEGQARRLVDFVGLPWDEDCLRFHDTRRMVRTASVMQVRQPIYRSSKGRWHAYAAHLQPLLAALGVAAP